MLFIASLVFPVMGVAQNQGDLDDGPNDALQLPGAAVQAHDPDPTVAQQEIARVIEAGMLPVGLEMRPGSPIVVLYALNLGNDVEEITLYTFDDLAMVNAGIREFIERGFAPVAFSRHSGGMTFLLIRANQEVGRWGIVSSALSESEIETSFKALIEDGYSPWGVSIWQDVMLVLAVEEPARESARTTTLESYAFDPDIYNSGIASAIRQGLYPWGMAIDESGMYVNYVEN